MPPGSHVVAGKVLPDFAARADDMDYREADDFDMDPPLPTGFEIFETLDAYIQEEWA